jgi:hypothetical protein
MIRLTRSGIQQWNGSLRQQAHPSERDFGPPWDGVVSAWLPYRAASLPVPGAIQC